MWYPLLSHRDLPAIDDESRDKAREGQFAFLRKHHFAGKILFSGPTIDRSLGIYVITGAGFPE